MVCVYVLKVQDLPDPAAESGVMEGLWEERKEKILRYKLEQSRKQSLGAGLLLKWALKKHGAAVEQLSYGVNGKPEAEGVFFNLSHSGQWAVCAISDGPVGCDVEEIASVREGIAERFFTENEVQHLAQFEGERRNEEFFRLWTLKESYMKMTGEGMSLGLDRFEFDMDGQPIVKRDGAICDCHIKEYELPGYKLAVCAESADFAETLQVVNAKEILV